MDSVLMLSSLKKSPLVTQSNKIIEARYSLTIAEQRLVLTLISMISPEDEDFKDYIIKISDFQKLLNLTNKDLYKRTEDTILKLASRVIKIDNDTGYLVSHWFSSAEYIQQEGIIKISFDKKLKPYFLQLKEQFTKHNLFTVANFRSTHTIRIYMLLKQYQNIGHRTFELQELKDILDIKKGEYEVFYEFKKRVINQSKKEFETKNKESGGYQSDITFELETMRTGRKISHLKFIIKKQAYQDQLPIDLPEPEEKLPAVEALEKYGISGVLAQQFVADQGEEAVFRCVALYEQNLKAGLVKNTSGGYLITLLQAGAGQRTEAEKQAEQELLRKQAEAEEESKRQQREEQKNQLAKAFRKKEVSAFLSGLSELERAEFLIEARQENQLIKSLKDPIALSFLVSKIPDFETRKETYIKANMLT